MVERSTKIREIITYNQTVNLRCRRPVYTILLLKQSRVGVGGAFGTHNARTKDCLKQQAPAGGGLNLNHRPQVRDEFGLREEGRFRANRCRFAAAASGNADTKKT